MQLSRYRCFACIFVFLAADMINLNFYPAGKASWIAVFLASLLALPFYRLCTFACSRVLGKKGVVLFPVYISFESILHTAFCVHLQPRFVLNDILLSIAAIFPAPQPPFMYQSYILRILRASFPFTARLK